MYTVKSQAIADNLRSNIEFFFGRMDGLSSEYIGISMDEDIEIIVDRSMNKDDLDEFAFILSSELSNKDVQLQPGYHGGSGSTINILFSE